MIQPIAASKPVMTYIGMNEWIANMLPGHKLVYHVGSLMHDRQSGLHFQTVHGVALAASEAYDRGEVTLVQRKLAPLKFEYIAIKKAPVLGGKDRRNQPAGRT